MPIAYPNQFRRIINLDERGECSFTVYPILPNGDDGMEVLHVPTTPWDEIANFDGSDRFDPTDPACIRTWLIAHNYAPLTDCTVLLANEDPEIEEDDES